MLIHFYDSISFLLFLLLSPQSDLLAIGCTFCILVAQSFGFFIIDVWHSFVEGMNPVRNTNGEFSKFIVSSSSLLEQLR